jgi:predicted HNH restriction endonuclease
LSEIGGEYIVDPVADLRPVCPNCHAVLHRRIPAYSIEEVRVFLGGCVVRAVSVASGPPTDRPAE